MEGEHEKIFCGRSRRRSDPCGRDLDIQQRERRGLLQRAVEIRGPGAQRSVARRPDEVPDYGVFVVIASHNTKALVRAMALTS